MIGIASFRLPSHHAENIRIIRIHPSGLGCRLLEKLVPATGASPHAYSEPSPTTPASPSPHLKSSCHNWRRIQSNVARYTQFLTYQVDVHSRFPVIQALRDIRVNPEIASSCESSEGDIPTLCRHLLASEISCSNGYNASFESRFHEDMPS